MLRRGSILSGSERRTHRTGWRRRLRRSRQIAGLDQVNLYLPASLAGAGIQAVTCQFQTAQGLVGVTNAVSVMIR